MHKKCGCGRVTLDIDADQCVIRCNECDWWYTYVAVPKRLIRAVETLLQLLQRRDVEASPDKGDKEHGPRQGR